MFLESPLAFDIEPWVPIGVLNRYGSDAPEDDTTAFTGSGRYPVEMGSRAEETTAAAPRARSDVPASPVAVRQHWPPHPAAGDGAMLTRRAETVPKREVRFEESWPVLPVAGTAQPHPDRLPLAPV